MLTFSDHLGSHPVFGGVLVAHIFSNLCCVLIFFVLYLPCLILTVSLDCLFLIDLSVFYNVYILCSINYNFFFVLDFLIKINSVLISHFKMVNLAFYSEVTECS